VRPRSGRSAPVPVAAALALVLAGCSSSATTSSAGAGLPGASVPAAALRSTVSGTALPATTLPAAASPGFTVLHRFSGCPNDGANPVGGVVVAPDGRLFGTTDAGGSNCSGSGFGTVYVFRPSGSTYAEKIIDAFDGADGAFPQARPSLNASGDLFVTTTEGGAAGTNGTITKFVPAPAGYEVATAFDFPSTGGQGPADAFLQADEDNVLYGTTYAEGSPGPNNFGSIVELTENGLAETDLYDFAGPPNDGANPTSHLVRDASGTLYGTTLNGGTSGYGTVFSFAPSPNGGTETVLWNFAGGTDGAYPRGGVVIDKQGNLYGTTSGGGGPGAGYGTVFKLKPGPGGYTEKILHAFGGLAAGSPDASLVLRPNVDLLYGTTTEGGGAGCTICGTIFQVSTTGTQFAILHEFRGALDGSQPFDSPLFWDGHEFFGTTTYGGGQGGPNGNGQGVLFRYVPE
jgi:uncharacterized repeat protein (TIGR03803 family)